jgi:hypothetical protein
LSGTPSAPARHRLRPIEIVSTGRGAWTGWAELAKAPTDEVATEMTAKAITMVRADVLCVVQAEDRPSLPGSTGR